MGNSTIFYLFAGAGIIQILLGVFVPGEMIIRANSRAGRISKDYKFIRLQKSIYLIGGLYMTLTGVIVYLKIIPDKAVTVLVIIFVVVEYTATARLKKKYIDRVK